MSKHTPGPWVIEEKEWTERDKTSTHWYEWSIQDEYNNMIAAGWRHGIYKRELNKEIKPELQANAHLIAAAPEMLDDLKAALIAIENGCETDTDRIGLIEIIRKTIAKAEGRDND